MIVAVASKTMGLDMRGTISESPQSGICLVIGTEPIRVIPANSYPCCEDSSRLILIRIEDLVFPYIRIL